MVNLLKRIAYVIIGLSIIVGIVQASQTDKLLEELLGRDYETSFRWALALTWWISGALTGIIFYALGVIIEHVENISYRLRDLEHDTNKKAPTVSSMAANSRSSLDRLKDFKI